MAMLSFEGEATGTQASSNRPLAELEPLESAPTLELDDIVVRFGGTEVVSHASLETGPGITFLIGPNGAGKSTVVSTIAGAQRAQGGKLRFRGVVLRGSPVARAHKGVTRTFQLPQVFSTLSVLENVMCAVRGQRGAHLSALFWRPSLWRRQEREVAHRAREILERCHLGHVADLRADSLSGGQAKLLELGRAIATSPSLMLLDEPFAGVAPTVLDAIIELLRDLAREGMSLVVIAHEMSAVEALADRVIVMDAGRVLAQGTYHDVVERADVQEAYLGVGAET
jgi:ABC-type branched-subunit amino acid transport system ATPase component